MIQLESIAPVLQQRPGSGVGLLVVIVAVIFVVGQFAGMWATFKKADQPGWAAIVPIYNLYIMLKIGGSEWWWLLIIFFIPILNIYAMYKMFAGVSKTFGHGPGTALGLWFLGVIFWPLLGFSNDQYRGVPA